MSPYEGSVLILFVRKPPAEARKGESTETEQGPKMSASANLFALLMIATGEALPTKISNVAGTTLEAAHKQFDGISDGRGRLIETAQKAIQSANARARQKNQTDPDQVNVSTSPKAGTCPYTNCPWGVTEAEQFFNSPPYDNIDMDASYRKTEPCTGDKDAHSAWTFNGMAEMMLPLVCEDRDVSCYCATGTPRARASWKPSTNHCSGPDFTGMNDNPDTRQCCDGHDYCYTTAFMKQDDCDAAFGNCLTQTADYTESEASSVLSVMAFSYWTESQQYAIECV